MRLPEMPRDPNRRASPPGLRFSAAALALLLLLAALPPSAAFAGEINGRIADCITQWERNRASTRSRGAAPSLPASSN